MGNLLKYHIEQGMHAAMFAMRGMESELPRMRAQAKLRVSTLNEDELYQLATMLTPASATKMMIDKNHQQLIEQRDLIVRTADEWIDDLYVRSDQFFRSN